MACTLEQYIRATIESGLIGVDELKSFMFEMPREKRPTTAEQLAKELVLAEKLTKYQAAAIYQGKQTGLMLGQYAVLDQIGAGAMGQVFKAQHRRMKRIVAIKVLPATALKSKDAVERFQREVQAAAKLLHPNIVAAYDADDSEGIPFLVLEYVDGIDLKSLYQKGPLPVDKALDFILQAARGLDFAHSQGVVHRDIKPANLLVDKYGTVKILDMGLARIQQELSMNHELTRSGEIMGTVDYMSPEQAVNTHEADGRSDQYSLGCTLYRLLTSESVYAGDSMVAKIVAHRKDEIPSLRTARSDVSPELDAVFQRMIAKNPADRYPTMADAIVELEACAGSGGSSLKSISWQSSGDPELKNFLATLGSASSATNKPPPQVAALGGAIESSPIQIPTTADRPEKLAAGPAARFISPRKMTLPKLTRRQWLLVAAAVGALVLVPAVMYLAWSLVVSRLFGKPNVSAKPAAEPENPNDLLRGIDLDRDTVSGRLALRLEGKAVVATAQAKLQQTREIPREYDLVLVAENRSASINGGLVVGIPSAGRQPSVSFDWHPNETDFLSGVATDLPYTKRVFAAQQATQIVVRLRSDGLTVLRDGETILQRKEEPAKFPENEFFRVPEKNAFFVGFAGGTWRLSRWELTPISK